MVDATRDRIRESAEGRAGVLDGCRGRRSGAAVEVSEDMVGMIKLENKDGKAI